MILDTKDQTKTELNIFYTFFLKEGTGIGLGQSFWEDSLKSIILTIG